MNLKIATIKKWFLSPKVSGLLTSIQVKKRLWISIMLVFCVSVKAPRSTLRTNFTPPISISVGSATVAMTTKLNHSDCIFAEISQFI